MIDSTIVDSLADEFCCHICLNLMEDPRAACEWGHTFCRRVSGLCSSRSNVLSPSTLIPAGRKLNDFVILAVSTIPHLAESGG